MRGRRPACPDLGLALTYLPAGIEQCPPCVALPEPAAISGASKRRSTGGECRWSQARKRTSTAQKTARRVFCCVMAGALRKLKGGGGGGRKRGGAKAAGRKGERGGGEKEESTGGAGLLKKKKKK